MPAGGRGPSSSVSTRIVHVGPPRHAGPGHLGGDEPAGRLGGDQEAHRLRRRQRSQPPQLVGVDGNCGVDRRGAPGQLGGRILEQRLLGMRRAVPADWDRPAPAARTAGPTPHRARGTRPTCRHRPGAGPRSAPDPRTAGGRRPPIEQFRVRRLGRRQHPAPAPVPLCRRDRRGEIVRPARSVRPARRPRRRDAASRLRPRPPPRRHTAPCHHSPAHRQFAAAQSSRGFDMDG